MSRAVAWLDTANGRGPHEVAPRAMKIAEETGEAVTAYFGVTGGPRKGTTAATGEPCDVVLAALVALATITGCTAQAKARLARHLAVRAARLGCGARIHDQGRDLRPWVTAGSYQAAASYSGVRPPRTSVRRIWCSARLIFGGWL